MADELKSGAPQTGPEKPQTFKEKIWQPILSPLVSLVVICLVTSLLLGLTNALTEPMIDANTAAAAAAARQELLPEADGFEPVALEGTHEHITSAYKATNGAGYVIESNARGYGGPVPVMVAFGPDGTIVAVKFLQNNETPGLGKKLETDAAFSAQFAGHSDEAIDFGTVDKIASSTISSRAAVTAINAAIALYDEMAASDTSPGAEAPAA